MAGKTKGLHFPHGNLKKKKIYQTHESVFPNVQCLNSKTKHKCLLTGAHEISVEDLSP